MQCLVLLFYTSKYTLIPMLSECFLNTLGKKNKYISPPMQRQKGLSNNFRILANLLSHMI